MSKSITIQHFVGRTEYASIVEFLREKNVAQRLGYANDNYSGTPVYSALMNSKKILGEGIRIGSSDFYPKDKVEEHVENYLNRTQYRDNMNEVIRLVRTNPALASKVLAIIK